jgi:hypothetical protein
MMALTLWPDAVDYIARRLDIQYGTVALLGVTALFSILILELLSIVSVQDRKITTLAQLVGILMQKQQQSGGHDPSLPTEAELHAMLAGASRQLPRGRGGFSPGKPVMMTIADQQRHDESADRR